MIGLPEDDVHRIVQKLLAARLAAGEGSAQPLVDRYQHYLRLKRRFEYAVPAGRCCMTLAAPVVAEYNLDDSRIPSGGMQLRCPKCGTTFQVTKQGAAVAPAKPVPLPGIAGATRGPAAPAVASGSVPLPGAGGTTRPPSPPAAASSSVPLPGVGGATRPPPAPRASGSVPLPGAARPKSGVAVPAAPKASTGSLSAANLFGAEAELPPMDTDSEPATIPPTPVEQDSDVEVDDPSSGEAMQVPSFDMDANLGVQVPKMGAARPPPAIRKSSSDGSASDLEVLDPGPARPLPPLDARDPSGAFR